MNSIGKAMHVFGYKLRGEDWVYCIEIDNLIDDDEVRAEMNFDRASFKILISGLKSLIDAKFNISWHHDNSEGRIRAIKMPALVFDQQRYQVIIEPFSTNYPFFITLDSEDFYGFIAACEEKLLNKEE